MRPERQLASEGAVPYGIALFCCMLTEEIPVASPLEHAINPGVKGQSPLELLLLEDCQEAGTPQ